MGSRTRPLQNPTVLDGVADSGANMLVGMVVHRFAIALDNVA